MGSRSKHALLRVSGLLFQPFGMMFKIREIVVDGEVVNIGSSLRGSLRLY